MIRDLWEYLRGLYRGWRGLPAEARVYGEAIGGVATIPPPPPVPVFLMRFPKYPLGCRLREGERIGIVDSIYADYRAAMNSNIIGYGWLEAQGKKPSSTDQIFYSLIVIEKTADDREVVGGAILAGENDVELVEGR